MFTGWSFYQSYHEDGYVYLLPYRLFKEEVYTREQRNKYLKLLRPTEDVIKQPW